MRLRLIDATKKEFPVQRLLKVLGVSSSDYFAWKNRVACCRQRIDMVLLAHVRSAFAVSNETMEALEWCMNCATTGIRSTQVRGPSDARERDKGPPEAALRAHHR